MAVAYATLSAECPTMWKLRSVAVLANLCMGTGWTLVLIRDAVRRLDEGTAWLGVGAVFLMGLTIVIGSTYRLAAERKLRNTTE